LKGGCFNLSLDPIAPQSVGIEKEGEQFIRGVRKLWKPKRVKRCNRARCVRILGICSIVCCHGHHRHHLVWARCNRERDARVVHSCSSLNHRVHCCGRLEGSRATCDQSRCSCNRSWGDRLRIRHRRHPDAAENSHERDVPAVRSCSRRDHPSS